MTAGRKKGIPNSPVRKTDFVSFRCNPSVISDLNSLAKQYGKNRSEVLKDYVAYCSDILKVKYEKAQRALMS